MANQGYTVKFTGQFDISQVTKGIADIKKQMSNSHIGEDLRKQLETALGKVEANIPALEKIAGKGEYNKKDLQSFQKLVQEVSKDMLTLNKLAKEADFSASFSEIDTNKIKKFEEQLNEVENKVKSLKKEIIKSVDDNSETKIEVGMEAIIDQLLSINPNDIEKRFDEIVEETVNKSEQAKQEIEQALAGRSKAFKQNSDVIEFLYGKDSGVSINRGFGGKAVEALQQAKEAIQNLNKGEEVEDASKKLERLYQLVTGTGEFEGAFNNPNGIKVAFDGIISAIQSGNFDKIKDLLPTLEEFSKQKFSFIEEAENEKIKLTAEFTEFLNERLQNLSNTGEFTKEQIESIIQALGLMNTQLDKGSDKLDKEETQIKAINETFGSLARRIESTISAMAVFNRSMQIVRSAINSVKELDAAFTQIAIVSEQSSEEAWKMFDSFNKLAKQYSITTKDLTEGAKLFYQQGLSAADTMKMVEASTVSAALGEVTMTEAANTLTAAIQGYNESASVAMDYTDKIAMVGAVSAADFNELSAAMEKTASSAYTAGIDFDHLLGYLGKMIEVTREAPANLGTAMKTIIARFEDMKKDPAKALEDGISFNKVEEALRTLGISMRDTAGEFRPLQEVFTELGMQWESLTRNQQAYIATVAAGSRQQSRFLSMMNNFDRTLELITESQNSAGAAARQYATYQDSIAAAQARLTASWEKFYSKIVDNDAIKFAINGLSSLVEALSKVPPAITAIGTAFGALSLQSLLQSKGGLIKIIGSLLGATDDSKQYEAYGLNAIQKFINGFQKGLNNSGIDDALKEKLGPAINEGTAEAVRGLGNLAGEAKKTGSAFDILKGKIVGATSALWSLITNPVFLAIAAAIITVTALGYAIYKTTQKANDAAKEVKKLNKEIDELNSKSKSQKDLINSYEELIRKTKRTEEEQKQLNNIIDQISETYKNANVYVDEYGNRHLTNVEILKQENQQLDDNIKKLKLESLAAQEAFLATNGNQWTQENITNAGLSSDFYSKWNTAINNSPADAALQNIEAQLKRVLPAALDAGNALDAVQGAIGMFAPDFDSDVIAGLISGMTNVEDIINAVRKAYIDAYGAAENFGQAQLVIAQELQRINIDRWALNFEVDPKQSGLKAAFIDMLKALPVEQFNLIGDNLKETFENSLKQLSDPKEIVKAQNFITDALKGSFEANKIYQEAQNAGVKLSNTFLNYMQSTLKEREKELKENTIAAVSNIFGGIDVSTNSIFNQEGITQKQAEKIVSQAEYIKNNSKYSDTLNNLYLEDLSPMMNKIDNAVEEAIKKGSTDGLHESAEIWKQEVTANKDISLPVTELFIGYVDQELHGVVDQIILELENSLSDARETLYHYKEFLDLDAGESLNNDQYSEIQAIFGNLTSQYIDINKEGKEYLTIAGKTELLERQKQKTLEIVDKLYKANNEKIKEIRENENLTNDQKANQIQKINRQNELLDKQKRTLEDIENLSKSVTAQTNISLADKYYKDLDVIKQAQKEAQAMNGRINRDTYNSLLSIDAAYVNYVNKRVTGEGAIYEATAENLKNIEDLRTSSYKHEVDLEKESLQRKINSLDAEIAYFESIVNDEAYFQTETTKEANRKEYESNVQKLNDILNDEEEASNDTLENQQNEYNETLTGQSKFATQYLKQHAEMIDQAGAKWNDLYDSMGGDGNPSRYDSDTHTVKPVSVVEIEVQPVAKIKKVEEEDENENPEEGEDDFTQEWAKKYLERAKKNRDRLQAQLDQLDVLAPDFEIPTGSGGKELEKELEALAKAAEELADAFEDLDKLLKDIRKDLADITVDYNPFTDLFEAWEAEWDYYYNIKNLINQIETQSKYIDNVISSDYSSAQDKLNAYDAKVGNITAKLAANDAYILTLRAGIAQQAKEFEEEFNEYYNVDHRMGGWQIFQRDTTLNQWEENINDVKRYSYELSKLINQQENELNLLEANQEALEQQRSAYESILSTVDGLIDSLKGNEDITVDLSSLEGVKVELQAAIDDGSVEEIKQQVRNLNDYIQELNWQLDLNDNIVDKELEDAYDDMQDSMSHIQDLIDTLNNKLAEQQELVQELSEIYNYYVDTAINMQQELYNAIVEQYQNEINQKKQEYDYLKQLDRDYLQSVKDNINKERQAREQANKEKNYQQSLQRAQLLQQDTSGAYRKELANLNKELESQKQELYDDLVDKQVEALEKEINKRHELYDMEVNALQERLDYMQENAILLWEMVNDIVAEGADSMMATLENTTNYINQNELVKERQRKQWETETQTTYKGVIEGEIESLNQRIAKGKEYIDSLTEIKGAIELNTETYTMSKNILEEESGNFQIVMENYMQAWTTLTSDLTGYHENWKTTVNILMDAMEKDIQALSEMGDEGGSIYILKDKIINIANEMYNAFIEERQAMRDSMNRQINSIEAEISAMVKNAGDAIQRTADSIQIATPQQSGGTTSVATAPTTQSQEVNSSGPAEEPVKAKKYRIEVYEFSSILDYMNNKNGKKAITLGGYKSEGEAISGAQSYIESMMKIHPYKVYRAMQPYLNPYKQGGFADFTGPAWLDGTKSQPEAVLNAKQTKLFTSMVSSLERTAANNSNINSALGSSYSIGDINTNINVDRLDNETDIDKVAKQVENRIMKSIHNRVVLSVV